MSRAAIILILLLSLVCWPAFVWAQGSVWSNKQSVQTKAGKAKSSFRTWQDHVKAWGMEDTYRHEFSVAGRLNSDGWSGGIVYARKAERRPRKTYADLRFGEVKDDKQLKQQKDNTAFPQLGAATSYVFGKINNLYTLQLGIGQERMILPGVLEGNLSVGFRYGGGFSLALLKPYYLRLLQVDYSGPAPVATSTVEKYNNANSDLFLDPAHILGSAGWTKGLGEMTYVPGIYGEAAFTIEPGKQSALIKVITLGIQGAAYTQSLPLMAGRQAGSWNGRLLIGLSLGKRWK